MPSLLREDSVFQLNSQLLNEFTAILQHTYPVHLGTWGTIVQGNLTPHSPENQHFDRLQIIPMASETATADASLLKFWWHQHMLLARNSAQERFATGRAGPTIISEHLQAFLLTAINLMKLARPEPTYALQQPEGPALASLAETLLETSQGTMTMDMKMASLQATSVRSLWMATTGKVDWSSRNQHSAHNHNQPRVQGARHRRSMLTRSSAESRATYSVSPIGFHRM